MKTSKVVTFDLTSGNYSTFIAALKKIDPKAQYLGTTTTWLINSNKGCQEILDFLLGYTVSADDVFVFSVDRDYAWSLHITDQENASLDDKIKR